METILEVKNLKKTFKISRKQKKLRKEQVRTKVAVNYLSFEAYKGEIFALLGPNGAGKTTTLRMISTLLKPDEGDCIVDGESVVENPVAVRGKIGFLTSELKLENFFTPNYLFDFFAKLHQVPVDKRDEQKQHLFHLFGIDKFAEVKVKNLSTGMKQKVSIAISLVHDPDIIIFDEPTNGLDVITAKVVSEFLEELKARGKTVIISTHIFSLVEKLADRVGIIINGKMVLCNNVSEIIKEKNLEEIFYDVYVREVGNSEN